MTSPGITDFPERSITSAPAGALVDDERPDRGDAAVADHDGLIRTRGRAGSVDHANVRERHDARVDLNECSHGGGECRPLCEEAGRREEGGERNER